MVEVSLSLGLSSSVRGSEQFIGQHPPWQPSLPTVAQRAASRVGKEVETRMRDAAYNAVGGGEGKALGNANSTYLIE